jgi:hypothetical protein
MADGSGIAIAVAVVAAVAAVATKPNQGDFDAWLRKVQWSALEKEGIGASLALETISWRFSDRIIFSEFNGSFLGLEAGKGITCYGFFGQFSCKS